MVRANEGRLAIGERDILSSHIAEPLRLSASSELQASVLDISITTDYGQGWVGI